MTVTARTPNEGDSDYERRMKNAHTAVGEANKFRAKRAKEKPVSLLDSEIAAARMRALLGEEDQ